MYDPAVQRAVLDKLARWGRLPEGDLIAMLSPIERLRYRPAALDDLEWDGLIEAPRVGDERMVSITAAGQAWLRQTSPGVRPAPNGSGASRTYAGWGCPPSASRISTCASPLCRARSRSAGNDPTLWVPNTTSTHGAFAVTVARSYPGSTEGFVAEATGADGTRRS